VSLQIRHHGNDVHQGNGPPGSDGNLQVSFDMGIRLHGPDREGIEERAGMDWSKIIEPKDAELNSLAGMLLDLKARRIRRFVFVNNHFEGCAPLTIERLRSRL
jgi:hypothetical protein